MRRIVAAAVVLFALGMALPLQASPITWTLDGVTSLGTSMTGSFVFDADIVTYSSIQISTSGGSVIPNKSWSQHALFGSFDCCLALVDSTAPDEIGANLLNFVFAAVLTNAGGTIPIRLTQQGTCNSPTCNAFLPYVGDPSAGTNPNVTGNVVASVGSPVPEPATLTLTGLGLAGMVTRYRRRRSAS